MSKEIENLCICQETAKKLLDFRDERDWRQFHNPKDLAISISLEASELLELFQWSGSDVDCFQKKEQLKEELADVLNYCMLLADIEGLGLDEILQEKLEKNAAKYPVEKAKGSKEKYDVLKQKSDTSAQKG
jgi:NTP pyrophosphatase (non-canonical NTP hydrolase)